MSVYEIIPFTDMTLDNSNLETHKRTKLKLCQRFCSDTPDCVAFTWNPDSKGTCVLKSRIGETEYKKNYQLYIKKGNSDYILLWIFIGLSVMALFIFSCKR